MWKFNFKNKKVLIAVLLALVLVIVAFSGKIFKPAQKPEGKKTLWERIQDFKVAREDLSSELIEKYFQEFTVYKNQVLQTPDKFVFDSLMSMAMIKYNLEDYKGAEEIWLYVCDQRPLSSPPFYNLGNLYANIYEDYPNAEKYYKKAIENDPAEISYYRNFFELYYYKYAEKKNLAEKVLLDALAQGSDNIDTINLLGTYYQEIGNKDKAIEYFEKSLKLDPSNEAVKRTLKNLK